MEGKVIIVTGSSAGIGAATALLLSSQGAKVTIHGRRPDRLAQISKDCVSASPQGHEPCIVVGNIEDADVRKQLVQATLDKFGRIDGLVNNAGWAKLVGWEKADLKDMQDMLDVHVLAPYDLSRQVMPQLIENKGSIVMVSSVGGMRGIPGFVPYITAKHAMIGMMRALAVETAKQGVRINSINPGVTATEMGRNNDPNDPRMKDFKPENMQKMHPNGRVGQSKEVAACIAFLLSADSSMVTGIEMPVDGGLTSALMWNI